jgi:RimJ/RimL family protein N-acetyltransferase
MQPSLSRYLRSVGNGPHLHELPRLPPGIDGNLNTERLLVRPMVSDDLYGFYECRSQPRFTALAPGLIKSFTNIQAAKICMEQIAHAVKRGVLYPWTVTLAPTGDYLGYVFLCTILGAEEQPRLRLEYGIDPSHWGHRYGAEALTAIFAQVFNWNERNFRKIEGSCLAQNISSTRTMERAGMRQVARLEEHYQHAGQLYTLCVFEIHRRDVLH